MHWLQAHLSLEQTLIHEAKNATYQYRAGQQAGRRWSQATASRLSDRELVDFALRELLRHKQQRKILLLKGKVNWEGDRAEMRTGCVG